MSEPDLARWVGRSESRTDCIAPSRVAAWNATLDRVSVFPSEGDAAPPGLHWALFPPLARESELGEDGHPHRGSFLPPVPLPRRMWAGSRLTFHRPLRVGERVDRRSTVTAVTDKQGRGGRLVFVTVRHSIGGAGEVAIEEEQDLVYRGPPAPATEPTPGPPVSPASRPAEPVGAWRRQVRPSVTLLFRYSALTFNGHRIHYDRQYAEAVDGYAGLVVHAPLIATLLLDSLERARPDRTVERFHFKAIRPTFDVSPFAVCGAPADDPGRFRLWSTDNAGRTAIEADAWAG